MRSAITFFACCLTCSIVAEGQSARRVGVGRIEQAADSAAVTLTSRVAPSAAIKPSGWAVASSLIVPGLGQAMLRQQRFAPYAAAEAFFLTRYVQHSREARRERDRYRTLAANVARAPFGSVSGHGTFEYYESMEHFVESGAFDAVLGGELDPEPDTTTFNGRMWLLARKTFWRDVGVTPPRDSREWRLAENFYISRAVKPELRWSWRDAQLQYDEFRRTIRRSNEAYRDALANLSVIIANHALSGVDALVSVRLRARTAGEGRGLLIRGEIPIR
ncbi:MAG TPA: hypothetical protein VGQ52_03820 [Gemmatimonadaceae bacterium]|nr:hypothetical protein [Gemmatimonadaceae bacterium]